MFGDGISGPKPWGQMFSSLQKKPIYTMKSTGPGSESTHNLIEATPASEKSSL